MTQKKQELSNLTQLGCLISVLDRKSITRFRPLTLMPANQDCHAPLASNPKYLSVLWFDSLWAPHFFINSKVKYYFKSKWTKQQQTQREIMQNQLTARGFICLPIKDSPIIMQFLSLHPAPLQKKLVHPVDFAIHYIYLSTPLKNFCKDPTAVTMFSLNNL